MFFILRCVFWLGLVFAHIDWSVGQTADREAFAMRPLLTQMLSSAGSAAAKGAKDFCDSHRQDCIGALIATSNAMNDPTRSQTLLFLQRQRRPWQLARSPTPAREPKRRSIRWKPQTLAPPGAVSPRPQQPGL